MQLKKQPANFGRLFFFIAIVKGFSIPLFSKIKCFLDQNIMSTIIMNASASCFNLRVYGICLLPSDEIIVSRESYNGFHFTKFPGGGLEYGEGLKEALIREWKEEANLEIEVGNHFYTTDFFQKSIYDSRQIISIYYWIKLKQAVPPFPIQTDTGNFELVPTKNLLNHLDLPIDKVVGQMLVDFCTKEKTD